MMRWPEQFRKKPVWCLYDDMSGRTLLLHPVERRGTVPCPTCCKELVFERYRANCCGQAFRWSYPSVYRVEPIGSHTRTLGRGWQSVRAWKANG